MLAVVSTALTSDVWYTIRATGVVALVLLTVTTVLGMTSASRGRSPRWPGFARTELHRRASLLALVFVGIHVLTAVLDTYVQVGLLAALVPFTAGYRPLWVALGTIAFDLPLAVGLSSALRSRIHPRTWRGIHWLAVGCWPLAFVHALGTGTDAGRLWLDVVAGVCAAAVAAAVVVRVRTYCSARAGQERVGATTYAVPVRPDARWVHPTPRTLERNSR